MPRLLRGTAFNPRSVAIRTVPARHPSPLRPGLPRSLATQNSPTNTDGQPLVPIAGARARSPIAKPLSSREPSPCSAFKPGIPRPPPQSRLYPSSTPAPQPPRAAPRVTRKRQAGFGNDMKWSSCRPCGREATTTNQPSLVSQADTVAVQIPGEPPNPGELGAPLAP